MDVEKTMEFILGQQALVASNLASVTERLDRLTARVDQTEEQIQVIARATHRLIETRESDRLAFEANQKEFRAQMAASNLRHEETTEKLDAMIRIVEDLLRKRNSSSN